MAKPTDAVNIVGECLQGRRPVDETTLSCIQELRDRMERLKSMSPLFEGVDFSPAAARLSPRMAAAMA